MGLPAESRTFPATRPWVPARAARAGSRIVSAARIRRVFFICLLQRQGEATITPAEFPGIIDEAPGGTGEAFVSPTAYLRSCLAARQGVEDLRRQRVLDHRHQVEAAGDPGDRRREL